MPLAEAAEKTTRELEEARKMIDDLQKEKAELSSTVEASKSELAARNILVTETLDANVALAQKLKGIS